MPEIEKKQNQIQVEIDDVTAQGMYVNLALITHAETEVVIDFTFVQPQISKARVRSRIITSPSHAKKLLRALEENIRKYEANFGKIEDHPQSTDPKIGFYH